MAVARGGPDRGVEARGMDVIGCGSYAERDISYRCSTRADRAGLRGRPDSPAALAQLRCQRPEPLTDEPLIDDHPAIPLQDDESSNLFIYAS